MKNFRKDTKKGRQITRSPICGKEIVMKPRAKDHKAMKKLMNKKY